MEDLLLQPALNAQNDASWISVNFNESLGKFVYQIKDNLAVPCVQELQVDHYYPSAVLNLMVENGNFMEKNDYFYDPSKHDSWLKTEKGIIQVHPARNTDSFKAFSRSIKKPSYSQCKGQSSVVGLENVLSLVGKVLACGVKLPSQNVDPTNMPLDPYTHATMCLKPYRSDKRPKRVMNSFMVFAQVVRKASSAVRCQHNAILSRAIAYFWHNEMSGAERQLWHDEYIQLLHLYTLQFPNYKYQPRQSLKRKYNYGKTTTDHSTEIDVKPNLQAIQVDALSPKSSIELPILERLGDLLEPIQKAEERGEFALMELKRFRFDNNSSFSECNSNGSGCLKSAESKVGLLEELKDCGEVTIPDEVVQSNAYQYNVKRYQQMTPVYDGSSCTRSNQINLSTPYNLEVISDTKRSYCDREFQPTSYSPLEPSSVETNQTSCYESAASQLSVQPDLHSSLSEFSFTQTITDFGIPAGHGSFGVEELSNDDKNFPNINTCTIYGELPRETTSKLSNSNMKYDSVSVGKHATPAPSSDQNYVDCVYPSPRAAFQASCMMEESLMDLPDIPLLDCDGNLDGILAKTDLLVGEGLNEWMF